MYSADDWLLLNSQEPFFRKLASETVSMMLLPETERRNRFRYLAPLSSGHRIMCEELHSRHSSVSRLFDGAVLT